MAENTDKQAVVNDTNGSGNKATTKETNAPNEKASSTNIETQSATTKPDRSTGIAFISNTNTSQQTSNNDFIADEVFFNSEAFKNAGYSRPNYDCDANYHTTWDPKYLWVRYLFKSPDKLSTFLFKYGVSPYDIRRWNPFMLDDYFYYWGRYINIRMPRKYLPHD